MSESLSGIGLTPNPGRLTDTLEHHNLACMFATRAEADRAAEALIADGIPRGDIQVIDKSADATTTVAPAADEGFWGSLKRLFTGDDDVAGYAEGINRGHTLLNVSTTSENADRVATTLERFNPIDLEAQEANWRREGWTGGMATGAGATSASMLGREAVGVEPLTAHRSTTGLTAGTTAPVPTRAAATTGDVGEQSIPVVEERLAVGKRDVTRGSVRVRSYVVERPVDEQVTLRDEQVTIERRPATGTVEIGADAFRERTIELTETDQEAVVSKTTHVTGEVLIKKTAEDRVQTVSDTVRHTEVEVDDTRQGGKKTTTTNTPKR